MESEKNQSVRKIDKEKLFIISILLMLFFYVSLGDLKFYIKFFVIVFIWFLFYMIWCLVFRFFDIKWFFMSKSWIFYSLFFIVSLFFLVINIDTKSIFTKLWEIWKGNIFSENNWREEFEYERDFITGENLSWNNNSELNDALWALQKALESDELDPKITNKADLHFLQNKLLTYKDLIPFIVKKYYLSSDNYPDIDLWRNIEKDDDYKYFKTAYYFNMFDIEIKDINDYAKCKDLMFFLWQAQRRWLQYTKENVYDVFWAEAIRQWFLNKWCNQQNKNVVWKDIP